MRGGLAAPPARPGGVTAGEAGVAAALRALGVAADGPAFSLLADGVLRTPATMHAVDERTWRDGDVVVRLTESPATGGSWSVALEATGVRHVEEVCLLDHSVSPAPSRVQNHHWGDGAPFQRSTTLIAHDRAGGWFACHANPFGVAEISATHLRLAYRPAMDVDGAFVSDPVVVGRFEPAGRDAERVLLPGRDLAGGREPGGLTRAIGPTPSRLDMGAARALRRAVADRVPWQPARCRVSHWDWGENAYRLSPADPSGLAAYLRMVQLCAELGVEVLLLSPGSRNQPQPDGAPAGDGGGPWQMVMWLAEGIAVGEGRWRPGDHAPGVAEVLDLCRQHGVHPAAYVNPQYLFRGHEDWAVVLDAEPAASTGYRWTCLGVSAARDHIVRRMEEFVDAHGLAGLSLDFVFWVPCFAADHGHESGEASLYAQWDGYRQILAALRRRPDAWVEALIGSQAVLPWGARDMTHPHPMLGDNQPQWVNAWPDLSVDRANANQQRRVAYWCRNLALLPSYKVPGQVGHQANRLREAPVERGWDWEGARYNLLSAIASAPSSLSICFLPCWDDAEWQAMRERDGAFFRRWLDFARDNAELLSGMEDLFDDPRPGAVDGTAALDSDGLGYVFLTNPDYIENSVRVPVPSELLMRELHPEPGRLWHADDDVVAEPHEVMVLQVVKRADVPVPHLAGASGRADADGTIVEASGRPGTARAVRVHTHAASRRRVLRFASDGVTPTLHPWRSVPGSDTVVECDWTPGAALPALLAQLTPPVPATGHELMQPWSDPSRLRLFLDVLDPESMQASLRVDGEEVPLLEAWMGTWPDVYDEELLHNNLMGRYADLHDRLLQAAQRGALETPWRITIELHGVAPGHFRGVHIAHLPRRTTTAFTVQ
jgi:hypothetical protein